jgi:hypothetical protein
MDLLNNLTERFKNSSIVRAFENEEAKELLARRKEWAEQIAKAAEEWQKVSPPLIAAEKGALESLQQAKQRAQEVIRKAEETYQKANRERSEANFRRDRETSAAEVNLRNTASPKIYQFSRKLEERRKNLSIENEWGRVNGASVVVATTAGSIQAAALRINRIICDELPKLALEPLTEEELELRFRELEQSIPPIQMIPIR